MSIVRQKVPKGKSNHTSRSGWQQKANSKQQALIRQLRSIHACVESRFEMALRIAKEVLPDEAKGPLFDYIIRCLWESYDSSWGSELLESGSDKACPKSWEDVLPSMYARAVRQIGWVENTRVEGDVSQEGMLAFARLLWTLRKRQRVASGEMNIGEGV